MGLEGASDPEVLAWAAAEGRILLTHDVNTVPRFAYERAAAGASMPGVFAVPSTAAIGTVIEDVLLLTLASTDEEWEGQVLYVPIR